MKVKSAVTLVFKFVIGQTQWKGAAIGDVVGRYMVLSVDFSKMFVMNVASSRNSFSN